MIYVHHTVVFNSIIQDFFFSVKSFQDLHRSNICSQLHPVSFLCPCSRLAHLLAQVSGAELRATRWRAAARRAGRRRCTLPPCRCGWDDRRGRRRQGSSSGGPEIQGVSGRPRHSGSLSCDLNNSEGGDRTSVKQRLKKALLWPTDLNNPICFYYI